MISNILIQEFLKNIRHLYDILSKYYNNFRKLDIYFLNSIFKKYY